MAEGSNSKQQDTSASFFDEFLRCWRLLSEKGFFGILLLAWVATFFFLGNSTFGYIDSPSLFQWMYTCYTGYTGTEFDDSHGVLIPFVVVFVLWCRRNELLALPRRPWSPAIGYFAIAIMVHLFGFAAQQPRVSIVGFFLGFHALIGVIWGRDWLKTTFMPFSLFAFCVPISSLNVVTNLTMPLRLMATEVSAWVARVVLGFPVTFRGTQIFDANGVARYEVAAACSGIRSLISLFVLMTVFGILTYRSPWRRVGLMLFSIPLALFCNVLRLVTVIIAGQVFGAQASEMTHEYSGFFTYGLAVICMLVLSRWWTERPLTGTATLSKS